MTDLKKQKTETAPVDDKDVIIAELRESNRVTTEALAMLAKSNSKLVAEAPEDKYLDLRRPEDILFANDDFEDIDQKWAAIIKDGGIQLYNVLLKPWVNRAKSEHAFIVCGLTAAEILYYHHDFDTAADVALGTTKAVIEVTRVNGMVSATDQLGVYTAMRETKDRGVYIYKQALVDRLFSDHSKIPMTVKDVTKSMPKKPDAKGIFNITEDRIANRYLIDKVVKLQEGGLLSIKYYEDQSTRTSGAGVLWRKTGISGG